MKLNFIQFAIAVGISFLFMFLIGRNIENSGKGVFFLVSALTLCLYLSVLIGFNFENRKIGMNIRALSLLFFLINLMIVLVLGRGEKMDINRFIAMEFIPALVYLSILSVLLKIKKV